MIGKALKCMHCDQAGFVRVEHDNWVCEQHLTERLNALEIGELNDVQQELNEFEDQGGRLS